MERTVLRVASALAFTMVLAMLLGVGLLKSSWGEQRARMLVEGAITAPDGTRVQIGRLGDFELFSPIGVVRATAEDVRLVDARGQDLINVGGITGDLDLTSLLRLELRFPKAKIAAAQIACDPNTGRPLIAAAAAKRRDVFEPRLLDLVMQEVEVVGVYGVATKSDGSKGIIGRLAGNLDMFVDGSQPGLKMNLRGIHGVLAQPQAVRLHDATGTVDTDAETAADINFRADARGAALTGRVIWQPNNRLEPVMIDIRNATAIDASSFGDALNALGGSMPKEFLKPMGMGMPLGL